jgi:hypothetical protein
MFYLNEFRTEIASTYCGLTFKHNTMHVGEDRARFRYGIPWITESELIPGAEPVP